MTAITETTEKLLRESAYQSVRIQVILADGTQIEDITSNDIVSDTFVIQRDSVCGDLLEIGNMTAADLKFTLDNKKEDDGVGKFDAVKFNGARLFCTAIVSGADGVKGSIPLGVFTVDNQPRALETIEITAMDETVKLVQEFKYTGIFPTSLHNLVVMGLTECGIRYNAEDLNVFSRDDIVENFIADSRQIITWRQVIMWACQLICTCAYADGEGILRFRFYETNETEYLETENRDPFFTEHGEHLFLDLSDPTKKDFILSESDRFADGSTFDEDDTVITGHQFKVGDMVYPPTVNIGYVLQTVDNLIFTYLNDENKVIYADAVNQRLCGFSYRKFSAETHAYPQLFPLDRIVYSKNGIFMSSIVTNHTFTLNGSSKLSAKAKSKEDAGRTKLNTWTPQQSAAIEQINKSVSETITDLSTQEKATLHLNQTAANAMGMYYSERADENGGIVRYWHDNASLENSLYICMQNSGGSFSTNTGWNDGNPHWTAGADKFGNAVVSLLNTVGIQAEWIRADSITTDKLSIGQSERGTNLIQDSSFEHGGVFVRGTYSGENEDVQIQSPAHNDHWNAVIFTGTDTYDIRYRDYLETPVVGGFDGNKAIVDVNFKGLFEDEAEWFVGYEQIQPIPIDMLTHTVSFYYRVRRNPFGTAQGAETANAKYAFKIQWLNQNGTEISCVFQSFAVQNSQDDTWHRLYTTVTPPNNAQSARFAIGFVCTDVAVFQEDEETGEHGYPDLAWCDLDGILFEQGNTLNTWTCSEAEVRNTGVIINSNGVNIADGKISVTDIFGRKVLYTDGNNDLRLTGGLTSQMYDQSTQKIYAQMQILPSDNKNPYDDSSGVFRNNFLGQTFTKFDENGIAQPVGHIGMCFTEYEGVSNDNPMEFYSENGFLFNGSKALICDPVEIGDSITYLAELQEPGWYTVSSDERAATLKQSPVKKAFTMQVCKFGNYILQYVVARDGETHQRVFDSTQYPIPGFNWYSLTGTALEEYGGLTDDTPPGVYLQSTDVPDYLVQKSTDTLALVNSLPTTDRGIFECFWGANGTKFHRYTDWRGQVWSRNYTKQYGWGFWRKNNVKT